MEKGTENIFRSKIMLAPMAGVGDYAFRMICKKHGADYMTSEMISAKAICYGDKKTPLLAKMTRDELPMARAVLHRKSGVYPARKSCRRRNYARGDRYKHGLPRE